MCRRCVRVAVERKNEDERTVRRTVQQEQQRTAVEWEEEKKRIVGSIWHHSYAARTRTVVHTLAAVSSRSIHVRTRWDREERQKGGRGKGCAR